MSVRLQVEVPLLWPEVTQAVNVGTQRVIRAFIKERYNRYEMPRGDIWAFNIGGALGEMAVAKWRNLFWSDNSALDYDGDVAHYGVRWTGHDHGGLIIHEDDPDERPFVCAVGGPPVVRLVGWLPAGEAKKDEYWRAEGNWEKRPAWCAPQSALREMESLP